MGSRFCKDGRSCWLSDVQAFLRYVDGKAAEGAFVQALDTEVKAIKQHKETRREYMTLCRRRENGRAKERDNDDIRNAA